VNEVRGDKMVEELSSVQRRSEEFAIGCGVGQH